MEFVIPAFFGTYGEDVEYDDDTPRLYISGLESSASINLTVTGQENEQSLTFSVGEGCTIPVLLNCRLSAKRVGTQNSALHIVADHPIAVRMHQEHTLPNMPTVFLALPTAMLDNEYFVVEPGNTASPTELIITAGGTGARLRISPGIMVESAGRSYDQGNEFPVNLQSFETFILRSDGDLTGTVVRSNNPVSVIVGDYCTPDTPPNTVCRQPSQLLPVSQWGQRYTLTSFISSQDSVFQFFAASDGTSVRLIGDGSEISSNMDRGESSTNNARAGNVYVIEADSPVYVILYSENSNALTSVPADNHRVTGRTSVPVIANRDRNPEAHVLINTACSDADGFQLDLQPVPRSRSIMRSENGADCIVRLPIERGNHVINYQSPDTLYSISVHVTDDAMSYAYTPSLSMAGHVTSNINSAEGIYFFQLFYFYFKNSEYTYLLTNC